MCVFIDQAKVNLFATLCINKYYKMDFSIIKEFSKTSIKIAFNLD